MKSRAKPDGRNDCDAKCRRVQHSTALTVQGRSFLSEYRGEGLLGSLLSHSSANGSVVDITERHLHTIWFCYWTKRIVRGKMEITEPRIRGKKLCRGRENGFARKWAIAFPIRADRDNPSRGTRAL